MIKDGQVRSLRHSLSERCTLRDAARRCGMDKKTARCYQESATVRTPRSPRSWRSRPDLFADVWPEVQARLESDLQLHAVTLMREHPERHHKCHRRTYERRVNHWRATTGPVRPVFFDRVYQPGRLASFDFTEFVSLDITIQRTSFPHLLFHATLTHSNVEWVRICFSESFEAQSAGLQAAFHEWGGAPERVRSNSLSPAVYNLNCTREFRARYQALLSHYDLEGERINPRCTDASGGAEATHGHLKTPLVSAGIVPHQAIPSTTREIRVWNPEPHTELPHGELPSARHSVDLCPDDSSFAVPCADGTLPRLTLSNTAPNGEFASHTTATRCAGNCPDSATDGPATLSHLATGDERITRKTAGVPISSLGFNPDVSTLAA